MKTAREILFERHRQAEPRLDAVRRRALAALAPAERAEVHPAVAMLGKLWVELIWPYRRAWTGMAVVWLAVLAANLEMKSTSPGVPPARSAPGRDLVNAVEAQRRLLAELLPPTQPPAFQAPRSSPRPRSERPVPFKTC